MLILIFIALLSLIFIGAPVILALDVVALGGILSLDTASPVEFPKRLFTFLDSFGLLALPYFILAGELLSSGKVSRRLTDFAKLITSQMKAGLGQASILACIAFANVSGSAAASTAAVGSSLIPPMREAGYKPGFSAALVACSGIIGSIIPPSMIMIVYGSIANVSIEGLFLAGVLPGLLIASLLMVTLRLIAGHPNFPELQQSRQGFRIAEVWTSFRKIWVILLAPVIVIGGIWGGFFTATEAGIVACLYAIGVSVFLYKDFSLAQLPELLLKAATTTAMIVGVISAAGALAYLLTHLGFDMIVQDFLLQFQNRWIALIILLAIMLVTAMFVESLAVLIILVPVIAQVGTTFGFDPLYFGMLIVITTQIGAVTPPVAVGLFVATSIADAPYSQTIHYCVPFILSLVLGLILVLLFPSIATFIPNIVHP